MDRVLEVNIAGEVKNYEIQISNTPIEALYKDLLQKTVGRKRLIVFSEKVYSLYSKNLPFPKNEIFILKDGENQKNLKNYLKIIQKLIKNKMSRQDYVICIGGGVVGDLAGFAAASYMRGIKLIQVPTTLLSMVDSSVGGKTAFDFNEAKNILGAFYQPDSVYINLSFLKTLDDRQYMSGLGEVLKYAFIEKHCSNTEEYSFAEFLVANVNRILERDTFYLERLIERCINFKINIVSADEKEAGLRKVLNLGHTFAHALETSTKYKKYTHGQAVVWGMFIMFKWALKNCYIDTSYYNDAISLLSLYTFKPFEDKTDKNKLVDLMQIDKKNDSGKIKIIVPVAPRQVVEKELANLQEFKDWLNL